MSTRATARKPRTDWRWILIALGLTVLQAAVIFSLSRRSPAEAAPRQPVPTVRVATGDLPRLLPDPRLLALPTTRGFAGIGWRMASDPQYVAQDWTEPMPWLDQSEDGLARAFLAAPAVGVGRGVTADKPPPPLANHALPPPPLPDKTVVRLEANGGGWEWAEPLDAPSIAHSSILGDTVVQATVGRSGQVFSAVVLRSSGLKSADQQALALALAARFRIAPPAADSGEWHWVRLVFEWRTLAPSATAGEAPAPGP